MNVVEQQITIEGEILTLTSLRAMHWEKEQALVVSDLHIGKSGHFRKHGIPISANVQHKDLQRLSFLVSHYKVKKLIVVGDLFHAEINVDMADFKQWREENSALEIVLIKGNHDRLKDAIYDNYQISCCQKELNLHPFRFIHEPEVLGQFSISGHLHPGVRINQKGRPAIKLPCYEVSASQLILPAFSEFTGLAINRNKKGKQFYAFTETAFFEF